MYRPTTAITNHLLNLNPILSHFGETVMVHLLWKNISLIHKKKITMSKLHSNKHLFFLSKQDDISENQTPTCLNLCDISIIALKKSHTQAKSNPDAPKMFMYWDNSEEERGQKEQCYVIRDSQLCHCWCDWVQLYSWSANITAWFPLRQNVLHPNSSIKLPFGGVWKVITSNQNKLYASLP